MREVNWIRLVSLSHKSGGDLHPLSTHIPKINPKFTPANRLRSTKWADETRQTLLCHVCVHPPAAVAGRCD